MPVPSQEYMYVGQGFVFVFSLKFWFLETVHSGYWM